MLDLLKRALEYGATKNGINVKKAREYMDIYAGDRRYKLFWRAATCSWSWNEGGIIEYRGAQYYYKMNGEGVPVEIERKTR